MKYTFLTDPKRKPPRMRPKKALHHFRQLVANKEDTKHVFHIIEELSGRSLYRDFQKFSDTPDGARRIAERRVLPALLDDHAALEKLPENSVGRAYLKFMIREGLSAAGLVQEYEKFQATANPYDDSLTWYSERLRDTHDLLHVLTGYGRDALGEACVLAFSHGQNRNFGIIFISYMTALEYKKNVPRSAPIFAAVRQAQRSGKTAQALAAQDISALLAEPLDMARARIGAQEPTAYRRVHRVCKAAGLDPFKLIT